VQRKKLAWGVHAAVHRRAVPFGRRRRVALLSVVAFVLKEMNR
jgi:hypothetical protein